MSSTRLLSGEWSGTALDHGVVDISHRVLIQKELAYKCEGVGLVILSGSCSPSFKIGLIGGPFQLPCF